MHRAIGIFDSGIGGLTVFKALDALLPHEDLVYLGDTARVPYGTKSPATVTRYSLQNSRFLLGQGVKAIVVACNTASAFAIPNLRRELDLPLLGVIEPGVEGALKKTKNKRVGVIGTEGTIASGVYPEELRRRNGSLEVFTAACPLFVPLAEEGMVSGEIPTAIAELYLKPLIQKGIDTLVLGCTHYPLLKETIRKVAGGGVGLIDSAEETAGEVRRLLDSRGLLRSSVAPGRRRFFATDHPDRFRRVGEFFLGAPLTDVEQVDL